MNTCYKTGSCGSYEMYSCEECPASKPIYKCLHSCEHLEICKCHIMTGHHLSCPYYSNLSAYVMKSKTCVDKNQKEEETKKVKVTKMRKNIVFKVKADKTEKNTEKEEVNSCPACTLKKYKSNQEFYYSFAPSFFDKPKESGRDNEEVSFFVGKENSTNQWLLYVCYHDEDYDMREINRELIAPIKYCPICGRELK